MKIIFKFHLYLYIKLSSPVFLLNRFWDFFVLAQFNVNTIINIRIFINTNFENFLVHWILNILNRILSHLRRQFLAGNFWDKRYSS